MGEKMGDNEDVISTIGIKSTDKNKGIVVRIMQPEDGSFLMEIRTDGPDGN